MKLFVRLHGKRLYGLHSLAVAFMEPLTLLILVLLTLAGAMLGLVWWQRRLFKRAVARELAKLKDQLARDFHDEMGSKLTVINLYGELARKSLAKEKASATRHHLDKVLDASRQLYTSMRSVISSLQVGGDRQESLWACLEQTGRELFAGTRVHFRCAVSAEARQCDLLPEQRRHLVLLVREALHNAMRHAHASEVCLTVVAEDRELDLLIEDDGRGFDPQAGRRGEGLNNMRYRARQLGGRLSMFSSDRGTRIQLRCPLPDPPA